MKLNCPLCSPTHVQTLDILHETHEDYYISQLLNDGTKKWYFCSECQGAYCFDKMTYTWQVSPSTYDKFVKEGILRDLLNED